jgi:hypothetical protein
MIPGVCCVQIFKKEKKEEAKNPAAQPWISMKSGVKIIAFTGIAMAVLNMWQVIPSKGWLEGIMWGLFFGVLIWTDFFGNILRSRFLRK